MSLPLKVLRIFGALAFLSSCSTFTGGGKEATADLTDVVQVAEMRTAELEVEVARLKADNARLANQVLDLRRSNEKLAAVDDGAADENLRTSEVKLPETPVVKLRESQNSGSVVVETAEATELEDDDVPVSLAPRMVQPTFASTDSVFENEAEGDIETASVLFGVHLASYRKTAEAREGWRKLQRENPDELGLLEPRVETVSLPDKGVFLRLIGGGFSSEEKAASLCASLKQKGLFCSVSGFEGQRLPLSETG